MVEDILSLYIHIPFCTKKCPYCHFYVVHDNERLKDALLNALLQELKTLPIQNRPIVSIYFGGGTPYLFGPERVQKFLESVTYTSDCEITIEANPETMDEATLQSYRNAGINRLSVGVQSFNDSELKYLGRTHSAEKAIQAIHTARNIGFSNISLDLMYEVPHQTLESWNYSLTVAAKLPITHISLYNLTIEPGTAFYRNKNEITQSMPSDEEGLKMYQEAQRVLTDASFTQYEISAFSRSNLFSLHNTGYWNGREFLGLGPSAFSFFNQTRYSNVANLPRYLNLVSNGESPIDFREEIDSGSRRRELLAVGLRLFWGLKIDEFEHKWGKLDLETIQELEKLEKQGFISTSNNTLFLTDLGRRFYDTVASQLI